MLDRKDMFGRCIIGITLMSWLPAFLPAALAHASDQSSGTALRIHRYSTFNNAAIATDKKDIDTTSGSAIRKRTQVSVHGKQLTLSLENNARLIEELPNHNPKTLLLRGNLEGKPASWVRMTQAADGTHGLIWDGAELYVVEPSAAVSSALAVSLPAPSSETVIFKLSDTTIDLGAEYCGANVHSAGSRAITGLATYQALTTELSQLANSSAGEPTLRLEMQALADAAFRAHYTSDQAVLDAILVRINNIDGIFTAQLGLEVQATNIQVYNADPSSLSQSTDASTLLSSLGQLRNNTSSMNTYALTHLFTGRDLDGDTLGIAYIGNICGARYGASLSEIGNRGAWIDSLVAAHELGHQLGAVHDGTGACADTMQSYLMASQINGSSELSQCSRDSIFATMQYAACLVPVGAPDMSVTGDSIKVEAMPDSSIAWSLPIQNLGTGKAYAPTVHITLPANLIAESSTIAGGGCVSQNTDNGGTVACQFDSLAANGIRQLELSLRASKVGNYSIHVNVVATGDSNPLNNDAVFYLTVNNTGFATGGAEPAGNQGGGGAINAIGLTALITLVGWRQRRLRQNAVQPL